MAIPKIETQPKVETHPNVETHLKIETQPKTEIQPKEKSHLFTWCALNRVSTLNRTNLKHEVPVIFRSDKPFYVDKGIDITAGFPNLTQFALGLSQSYLEFGQFPAEIRNIIYSYTFEDLPQDLQISLVGNDKPRAQIKTGFHKYRAGSLLLVNRQISQDARSWLYASKTFSFHYQYACERFLGVIGPENRSFIRKVELQTFGIKNKGSFEQVLKLLQESPNFETLHLSDYTLRATYNAIKGITCKSRNKTSESSAMRELSAFVAHFALPRGIDAVQPLLVLTGRHEAVTNPSAFGYLKAGPPAPTVEEMTELKKTIYDKADALVLKKQSKRVERKELKEE